MSIGLETAKVITAAVRAAGKERGLKPLTVVVLDAGGHVVSAEREDGASNNRFEIAYGKAYGALALGMGSRSLMARAEQQAYFITSAAAAIGGRLVPVPGGVLVKDRGGGGARLRRRLRGHVRQRRARRGRRDHVRFSGTAARLTVRERRGSRFLAALAIYAAPRVLPGERVT